MFASKRQFTRLFLPLALIGFHCFAAEAAAQTARASFNYAPPILTLTSDPSLINACEGDAATVQLVAKASSPNGNPIRYSWKVAEGRIDGEGPTVTWNLTGVRPGQHKAYLVINTGNGDEECEVFANTIVSVRCTPNQPVLTCPSSVPIALRRASR